MSRSNLRGLAWALGVTLCMVACGGRTILDVWGSGSGGAAGGSAATGGDSAGGVPVSGGQSGEGGAGGEATDCLPDELACPMGSAVVCVNASRDATNCGACGRECAEDAYCDEGVCRALPCTRTLVLGGPPLLEMGAGPVGMALADLNGDGRLDLTTANYGGDANITIRYGAAGGAFLPATMLPGAPEWANAIAAADLDSDGSADLITLDSQQDAMYVHFGSGSNLTVATAAQARAVASGDFNADTLVDLVVVNAEVDSVSVWLQQPGWDRFPDRVDQPTGVVPHAVAVGDVNGDDVLDLVVASGGGDVAPSVVNVHVGAGDGSFTPPVEYPMEGAPGFVTVADMDRDGRQDVVYASWETNTMGLLSGAADGALVAAGEFGTGARPRHMTIADLNQDGWLDVATANQGETSSLSTVSVLLADGEGGFDEHRDYPAVQGATAVAAADLTDDGQVDLAVACQGWQAVAILVGRGDGTFDELPDYAVEAGPTAVAIGDLNADERPDLAVANYDAGTVSVLHATADGSFVPGGSYPTGDRTTDLALADLDGDARLDLAASVSSSQCVDVWLGRAGGGFEPQDSYSTTPIDSIFSGPTELAVGDLNADGALDIVTANYDTDPIPSTMSVLLGNADGTFAPRQDYPTAEGPCDVAIGDLTGDGVPDLAVGHLYASVASVFRGRGDGTFDPKIDYFNGGSLAVAIGDLDQDGRQDLVVGTDHGVAIRLGWPDGTLGEATQIELGYPAAHKVAVADMDADGRLDVLATRAGGSSGEDYGTVIVLPGNGDGTFGPKLSYVAGNAPSDLAVRDLNDDGRPDVVVTNRGADSVTVLWNTCP